MRESYSCKAGDASEKYAFLAKKWRRADPGGRSGNVTKLARLQTGLEIKAPLYIQVGEKVKVYTETREFAGRA